MIMVDRPTGFILFHDAPGAPSAALDTEPKSGLNDESLDYLRAREHAERRAAKYATSTAARAVHHELAHFYAREVDEIGRAS
jgi:hypothetical protein